MTHQTSSKNLKKLSFEDTQIAFASKSDFQLRKSYWIFAIMNQNWLVKLGTFFIKLFLFLHLPVKKIIKTTLFGQFCGGESIQECQTTIQELDKAHIGTILDYSVEGEENDKSFQLTKNEILKTIIQSHESSAIPYAVFKMTGIFNSELLEKYQTEKGLSEEEEIDFLKSKDYLIEICQEAYNQEVRLFIDAEESWIQNTIDELCYEMMQRFNHKTSIIFNTFQMYRVDMLENLHHAIQVAQDQSYFLGVKLVRGAYLEKERLRAHEDEYSEPLHKEKEATDRDFNLGIQACLDHLEQVHFCVGTHNEQSCRLLCQWMEEKGISQNHPHIYFAQLLGMSDNISYNLASSGYNVAKYVPYGPVSAVMPYLFRRAEENSSIAGQTSREFALLQKEVSRRKNL
ncbi:proline dehydrogenase family protein [Aquirufa sp. WAEICH-18A]|uniref:Proline dehydrogenase family protein n=1 Tax=Aquirufa aurantiipilula TaxID=2696561 RepID=A0ABT6BLU2_9BACT|nr:proline dehydrogenase family protein [Aquirufa aurantiipilula]MDF5691377.1 proline dehydrogenase family protein [Aquirufa aurantiipilula]